MKTRRIFHLKSGFTLVELLVSMAITMIIVTVLVSVTSMAMDTWNRSRSELRAARQAKAMVDTMARDFEGLVTRSGNTYEWLSAISKVEDGSSNAADLVFFTAATDRYNGEIGTAKDLGGDVSCVGYKLAWKDPIAAGGADNKFKTFVLNRYLVDPRATFDELLGKTEIGALFVTKYDPEFSNVENFVCENIFQFTVSFHVEVTNAGVIENRIVNITRPPGTAKDVEEFRIKGTGIETIPVKDPATDNLKAGKITAVGISVSVLSDSGITQLPVKLGKADFDEWLAKNSNQYSKVVQIPSM
jgi:type II secretory pathway pseudopilin PulG